MYILKGLYTIKKDGKYGFLSSKPDKIFVEPQFEDFKWFSFEKVELISIKKNGKWGCIDTIGNIAIEPQFDDIGETSEGLVQFKKDDKWGFINKTGEIVIEPQFEIANSFKEGFAIVKKNGKYGIIKHPILFSNQ